MLIETKDVSNSELLTSYIKLNVIDSGSTVGNWDLTISKLQNKYPQLTKTTIENRLCGLGISNPYIS